MEQKRRRSVFRTSDFRVKLSKKPLDQRVFRCHGAPFDDILGMLRRRKLAGSEETIYLGMRQSY